MIRRRRDSKPMLLAKAERFFDYVRGWRLTGRWGVAVQRGVLISGGGELDFAPGSGLSRGCRIHVAKGATFTMRRGALVSTGVTFNVQAGVTLHEDTLISWNCNILDSDFHSITFNGQERAMSAPIELGPRLLVGTGSIILKGVVGGADSVIAAGSVVRGSFPANSMVVGNPARRVGHVDQITV